MSSTAIGAPQGGPPLAQGAKPEVSRFDYWRKTIGLFGGPLVAILLYATPIEGLAPEAHSVLAIMALMCIWWVCEPVPMAITSVLGPILVVILGVVPVKDALASFSNPTIAVFLGGFILAGAMVIHGVDKRFAFAILSMKWVGSNPARIMLAFGAATAIISGWISNTACAAMMFPLALGLLEAMREMFAANGRDVDMKDYKYSTGLLLMTCYAAAVGGVLTPIGTPPNLLVVGFLDTMAGIQINFFQWMIWGFIAMVGYYIIVSVVLHVLFPADVKSIDGAEQIIAAKKAELGEWTQGQKMTVIVFAIAVILWVTPGVLGMLMPDSELYTTYRAMMPESVVALLAAVLLFVFPVDWKNRQFVLTWKEASSKVEWGVLLLFGGGLAMGGMMFSTGLAEWMGNGIVAAMGGNPPEWLFIAVFCVVTLAFSEVCSHTASINMLAPLAITAAMSAGFNPVPVAAGMALASSLGFMLPVCAPPNAIVYASGMVPLTKMIKSGFFIDIVGIAVVVIPLCIFLVSAIT